VKLTIATTLAALTYIGVEVPEGANADALLDEALAQYNLTRDQFLTEGTMFAMGYHRALAVRAYNDDQVPVGADGKPSAEMSVAVENGFAFGLEARDLAKAPPPSLVFEGFKSGALQFGALGTWVSSINLATTSRLSHAVEVGSGKSALTIPAGTPVDIIGNTTKDGVDHVIVAFDGAALIIPNPSSDPRIVSGDTAVAPARVKQQRGPRKKEGGEVKAKSPSESGPTLKGVIIDVIEGNDGGPGPLQSSGAFASRVLKLARERGIGDKASNFIQKADKHVPYYINCYKPTEGDHTGRLGVEAPKAWVCAAIEARKYYLRTEGDHDARMAAIPAELVERMKDRAATLTTTPAPEKEKSDAVAEA
jgi:hypothetical protein